MTPRPARFLRRYPWRRHLLFLAPLGVLLAVLFALPGPERELPARFRDLHETRPAATRFLTLFSKYGDLPLYAGYALLLAAAVKNRRRRPFRLILAYLVCLALLLVVLKGIKTTVGRPRPFVPGENQPFSGRDRHQSFPSTHVAATLYTALLLALYGGNNDLAAALGLWPAVMALSRVYLGRHFPSDALGSLVVASGMGICAWCVWRWLAGSRRGARLRRRAPG